MVMRDTMVSVVVGNGSKRKGTQKRKELGAYGFPRELKATVGRRRAANDGPPRGGVDFVVSNEHRRHNGMPLCPLRQSCFLTLPTMENAIGDSETALFVSEDSRKETRKTICFQGGRRLVRRDLFLSFFIISFWGAPYLASLFVAILFFFHLFREGALIGDQFVATREQL